tara:strand:- start:57 stop:443 length:387 start_codon:yes stop_codon:yes gene_type:complete
MAHFVEVDSNNIVIRCLVVDDKDTQDSEGNEIESIGATYLSDGLGGTWKKTSYNTHAGIHKLGGTPYRKNYAGKGFTYDETRDAFIPPKPFPSWVLNEDTCLWDAPVAMPDDGNDYDWNEDTTSWDEI